MAVGPASDSRAIYVTPSFVSGGVAVVLLFITPVVTFQLQNTDEPRGRWWTMEIRAPPRISRNKDAWKDAPCWRWTCKAFVRWGTPSRCAAAEEPSASCWRSSIQRRQDSGPAGTPRYSGSTYGRRVRVCTSSRPCVAGLANSSTYQKGKMIILETMKTTVNTTNMALAVWCHLA